jgi:putative endonuclease
LDRNVRVTRGEIDLVARDAGTLVFVEVKTRRSGPFGLARESVTSTKAVRLTRLGLDYLARHGLQDVAWRIDVVAIDIAPDGGYQVDIVPNAVSD